ncbi:hypothetical protein Dda_7075 [Drechslerella dactyloides]|uniref:Uncharacterized protein n=1 Tax=Drechslerella dactyloides TaxID=74499 RepID=A0AAD6NIQ6_DREDA|nr:hypothetical protein Dda_7075 [Drechslerella dactyloides]
MEAASQWSSESSHMLIAPFFVDATAILRSALHSVLGTEHVGICSHHAPSYGCSQGNFIGDTEKPGDGMAGRLGLGADFIDNFNLFIEPSSYEIPPPSPLAEILIKETDGMGAA